MPLLSGNSTENRRRGWPFFAVTLPLLLVGSLASAANPPVTPVDKGQPAPFDGMLYPTENAIRLSQKAERCEFIRERDAIAHARMLEIEIRLATKKADIALEKSLSREMVLSEELEKTRNESLLTHPAVIIPLTVLLTYAILTGAKELPL